MAPLTQAQKDNCSYAVAYLFPRLAHLLTPTDEDETYEKGDWRVRSHWFDPHSEDPARPPMLEVTLTRKDANGKNLQYWFYRKDSGNDKYPEYAGWRVHAWIG